MISNDNNLTREGSMTSMLSNKNKMTFIHPVTKEEFKFEQMQEAGNAAFDFKCIDDHFNNPGACNFQVEVMAALPDFKVESLNLSNNPK